MRGSYTRVSDDAEVLGSIDGLRAEWWRMGDQVYRVSLPYVLDAQGFPMSRRWECSVSHLKQYAILYPDITFSDAVVRGGG